MSLSDLASLGSFVSGVAVLVSLIYLALQVRQSKQHTAAQISQARVQLGASNLDHYIGDPETLDILLRGGQGDGSLSTAETLRYHFLVMKTLMAMEDEFRQFKEGLISAERHNGYTRRVSAAFRSPGFRAMWTVQRDGYEPDFQAFVDPLMQRARDNPSPLPVAEWHAAVANELASLDVQ